jgi:hypothetical protein
LHAAFAEALVERDLKAAAQRPRAM